MFMSPDTKLTRASTILKVGFILLPEFDLLSFTGFVENLRQATDLGDLSQTAWARWTIMGHDLMPIKASCGLVVEPDEILRDPEAFDYVVAIGGKIASEKISEVFPPYLAKAVSLKVPVIGLGSAIFVLARAGLLNRRRCVVFWPHYQKFKNLYPDARIQVDKAFVEDRGVITCPGGSVSADLVMGLMERFYGPELMAKILRRRSLDWNRPEDRTNVPGLDQYHDINDPRVRRAVFFMEQNLTANLTSEDTAREAGISTRQLERLFQDLLKDSPAGHFRKLRLRRANWLLLHTRRTITDIAQECGFSDSSHFAKRYKEFYGHAPSYDRKSDLQQ
ncbi:AraC family transcriptional regulator [Deltaproteobacteria bacterium Smac51]|nr:AraC family transcriptional regulator [Deltaproteobacteria bacterium Smac51]